MYLYCILCINMCLILYLNSPAGKFHWQLCYISGGLNEVRGNGCHQCVIQCHTVSYSVISVSYSVISVSYSVIQCHQCVTDCHNCLSFPSSPCPQKLLVYLPSTNDPWLTLATSHLSSHPYPAPPPAEVQSSCQHVLKDPSESGSCTLTSTVSRLSDVADKSVPVFFPPAVNIAGP